MQDYFFLNESKVYMKFMFSLYVILKTSHENYLDIHEIFRHLHELFMKFLCSFYVVYMHFSKLHKNYM